MSGNAYEGGSKVEDLIMTWDLQVLNIFSRLTTFNNNQGGRLNIDVTLATRDIVRRIR